MRPVEFAFAGVWIAFWFYWFVAARSRKPGRARGTGELGFRLLFAVVVVLLVRLGVFRHPHLTQDPWRAAAGLLLLVSGLGFAVWARLHIGRNWGTPMTRKDDPELVTSGPYRLVRHPIYAGILAGLVATAVGLDWLWLVAAALVGLYFLCSAVVEERDLGTRFPDTYPSYRRATKMLVPHVF